MPKHDLLTDFLDESPAIVGERKLVPNLFPRITNTDYKIAIIGEAPGSDETALGEPFVGASGRELDKYLSKVGILRDACYIGNICQYQPPGNKLAAFDWNGPEIQGSLTQLKDDLNLFRPNLCWLLGGSALHVFKCGNTPPTRRKTKDGILFNFPNGIGDWRGSLFSSHTDSPLPNIKCLASYHPAAALRNYEWMPTILLDLLFKVCPESKYPELNLPIRELDVSLDLIRILTNLDQIRVRKTLIALDIEGGVNTMSCLSIAIAVDRAFIIPFTRMDGTSLWGLHDECMIWTSLAKVLGDPNIPKVLQNSLYDRFVLQYSYGVVVRGVVDDTMLKWWELYCEMPKKLGFQASVLTREPYWKNERIQAEQET